MIEQAALLCEPLGQAAVVRAHGVEAMSELPRWTVDVLCDDGTLDLAKLIGAAATLAFGDDAGGMRAVPLVVREASYGGMHRDGHRYRLELSAALGKLTLRAGYRIFQHLTTQEIVSKVLQDAGVSSSEIVWRLSGRYQKRAYCVQYRETEWDFVERLLADEGINVWFDSDGGREAARRLRGQRERARFDRR